MLKLIQEDVNTLTQLKQEKHMSTKMQTLVGELKYVFIKGEGRNQARDGEEPRMQFVASITAPKDGPFHKNMQAHIDAEWTAYKTKFGAKGLPKTNGIKEEFMKDPKGEIDPATEEIKKVPTGNIIVNFKTNTTWPNGNAQVVKVFDHKGNDITVAVTAADWAIGSGSTGIIHGSAMGNNVGGDHKVTLYLSAVQLSKLVKYEGNEVDAQEIEGDDIDLGDSVGAIASGDEAPKL